MAIGAPVIIKPPKDTSLLGVSHLYKCVISGDPALCSTTTSLDPGQGVNIFIDTADSDVDIPIFLFPSGTIIEDFGFEIFDVWTEAVHFHIGDSDAADGWGGGTGFLIATDTNAAGEIRWASRCEDSDIVGIGSTTIVASTAAFKASYLAQGPKVVYFDASDTGCTGQWSTDICDLDGTGSDAEPWAEINLQYNGAVVLVGGMNLYLRVNFANLERMAPSSELAIYS